MKSNGIKGAFYNVRAALPDRSRCSAFDASIELLVTGIVAVLPDIDTGIKFGELCNELESEDYDGNAQIFAITEFAVLTCQGV